MTPDIVEVLQRVVGEGSVLSGDAIGGHSSAWATDQPCLAKAIVCPGNTTDVAEIMKVCHANGQSVVPYGGITNLVRGCTTTPDDIALSFEKMNEIEDLDLTGHTMTVQAGVRLQEAQEHSMNAGLFFPVDIGARGSCMVGGNVATNAGGTKVIRYGMMRESVLGLEAVLADGTIISSLNRFLKNNSGFDLKHLFIGSEGVLGLVTRIVFRLHVLSRSHNVALVACNSYERVVDVLAKSRVLLGSALCGFEVMWDDFFDHVTQPVGRLTSPIRERFPLYVIIETMGSDSGVDRTRFEAVLEELVESGKVADGVIAKSDKERSAIWALREEVEWLVEGCCNFDVSLPIADVGQYVNDVKGRIKLEIPSALVAAFGHLGDNNIHISVLCEGNKTKHARTIEHHVYESLRPFHGAISAEHGIGLEKKPYLSISRSKAEIELMRTLKASLDPKNILNPGKVISIECGERGSA